ncbi:hypothetical protein O4J56_17985 [Nocardiopsis sp. RSe5-2]|uniref:Uncharacterized protein n=1 Tax=Nocardiopsis endophytica TaxID=3018445 RepID=A0ABT4U7W5_9ACTN|nr:hypothetical protein [Nocardiopsis endophytica]MDA2812539.1 hypothetical protein [Nocardiopsis endophytica]
MDFFYALSGVKLSATLGQELLVQVITVAVIGGVVFLLASDRPMVQIAIYAALVLYAVGRLAAVAFVRRGHRQTTGS